MAPRVARLTGSFRRSAVSIGSLLSELLTSPQSALGTLIVLFFLTLAIFGSRIAPYAQNDQSSAPRVVPTFSLGQIWRAIRNDPASLVDPDTYALGKHPFGTDYLGRDVFSRVVLGSASIFRVAGLGTLFAVILGTLLGLLIGYQGGWLDEIVSRLIDALLAMPALLITLVTLGVVNNLNFRAGSWQQRVASNSVLIVIALVYVPIVARVIRSVTLDVKTRTFVQAAQLRGESRLYILLREIFPSAVPVLVVEASLRFSYAIFLVAALGFLGVAARPPSPDWGLMVSENSGGLYPLAPWAMEFPAAAIAVLVIGVNLMSDGIKRAIQKSG
jgi:peptide/nickel transport system permease protein